MGFFDFKSNQKDLKRLLKERDKKDRKLNKEWEKRNKDKYSADVLRAAKNQMLKNAMTIDSLEYEVISKQLKEKLKDRNYD